VPVVHSYQLLVVLLQMLELGSGDVEEVLLVPGPNQQPDSDSNHPAVHMAASHGGKWLAVADSASRVLVINVKRTK
jgi:hypothetical protein